ncbi:MAG: hypothetical protein ACTSVC_05485 [Promethearchaeota archaeon]
MVEEESPSTTTNNNNKSLVLNELKKEVEQAKLKKLKTQVARLLEQDNIDAAERILEDTEKTVPVMQPNEEYIMEFYSNMDLGIPAEFFNSSAFSPPEFEQLLDIFKVRFSKPDVFSKAAADENIKKINNNFDEIYENYITFLSISLTLYAATIDIYRKTNELKLLKYGYNVLNIISNTLVQSPFQYSSARNVLISIASEIDLIKDLRTEWKNAALKNMQLKNGYKASPVALSIISRNIQDAKNIEPKEESENNVFVALDSIINTLNKLELPKDFEIIITLLSSVYRELKQLLDDIRNICLDNNLDLQSFELAKDRSIYVDLEPVFSTEKVLNLLKVKGRFLPPRILIRNCIALTKLRVSSKSGESLFTKFVFPNSSFELYKENSVHNVERHEHSQSILTSTTNTTKQKLENTLQKEKARESTAMQSLTDYKSDQVDLSVDVGVDYIVTANVGWEHNTEHNITTQSQNSLRNSVKTLNRAVETHISEQVSEQRVNVSDKTVSQTEELKRETEKILGDNPNRASGINIYFRRIYDNYLLMYKLIDAKIMFLSPGRTEQLPISSAEQILRKYLKEEYIEKALSFIKASMVVVDYRGRDYNILDDNMRFDLDGYREILSGDHEIMLVEGIPGVILHSKMISVPTHATTMDVSITKTIADKYETKFLEAEIISSMSDAEFKKLKTEVGKESLRLFRREQDLDEFTNSFMKMFAEKSQIFDNSVLVNFLKNSNEKRITLS